MEMSLKIGRLKLYVERIGLDGLLSVFGFFVDVAEVVSDLQFGRTRPQNLCQTIDRFRVFLQFSLNEGHTKLGVEIGWIFRNQVFQFLYGPLIILGVDVETDKLMADVAVSRVDVLQIFFEHPDRTILLAPGFVYGGER